ncbi:MAG TPA: hypothetical protein PLK12_04190 [Prolixibacteraceae bacterium]|nr:hypothetical protein [Prolixibacteraceae bacterium]
MSKTIIHLVSLLSFIALKISAQPLPEENPFANPVPVGNYGMFLIMGIVTLICIELHKRRKMKGKE